MKLSFWWRFVVGAILLVIIVTLVNAQDLVAAFQQAALFHVLAAAILVAANIGLQIVKWNYMLRFIRDVSEAQRLASFFFGITLGSFTPGQIGEFGGRALHLPSDSRGTAIGLAIIDRLQIFGVMAIGGIVSLIAMYRVTSVTLITFAGVVVAIILVFLMRFSLVHSILSRIRHAGLKYSWIGKAIDSLTLFRRKDILITTCLSFAFYGVVYFQLYCLMNAFHRITVTDSFMVFAAMMFSKSLLPLSIADLGIREFGLVYFAEQVGYPTAAALASSLLLFVINIAGPSLVGLFFVPRSIPLASTKS